MSRDTCSGNTLYPAQQAEFFLGIAVSGNESWRKSMASFAAHDDEQGYRPTALITVLMSDQSSILITVLLLLICGTVIFGTRAWLGMV